jgi:hypothetical protein
MVSSMVSRGLRATVWALCVTVITPEVFAQFSNPRRSGSPRRNEPGGVGGDLQPTLPIGLRDCADEVWTFNVAYGGEGAQVTALQMWIGTEAAACMNMTSRQPPTPTCWRIQSATITTPSIPYANDLFRIPARYLVDPVNGDCAAPPGGRGLASTNHLSLIVEASSGTTMSGMSIPIAYDLQPPEAATNITAMAGEESAEIAWRYAQVTSSDGDGGTSSSVPMDLQGFWVLCDPPPAREVTDAGAATDVAVSDASIDVPDKTFGDDGGLDGSTANVGCVTAPFPTINPNDDVQFNRYRRSELVSPAATRARVSGLRNGVGYRCVVVAQDNAGNRAISGASQCVVPRPVTDFWERYRASGGGAHGMTCSARSGAPLARSTLAKISMMAALAALVTRRWRRS